jgi:hypothetical protein
VGSEEEYTHCSRMCDRTEIRNMEKYNISRGRCTREEDLAFLVSVLNRERFGPKRDEVTGGWRKLHNEELHNLYSSPSIIRMIKSRKMR